MDEGTANILLQIILESIKIIKIKFLISTYKY